MPEKALAVAVGNPRENAGRCHVVRSDTPDREVIDEALRAEVHAARKSYFQKPTSESRAAYRRALLAFAGLALRGDAR